VSLRGVLVKLVGLVVGVAIGGGGGGGNGSDGDGRRCGGVNDCCSAWARRRNATNALWRHPGQVRFGELQRQLSRLLRQRMDLVHCEQQETSLG